MRLRSLGNGYTEKDIEKRIAGEEIEEVLVGSNKAASVKTTKEKRNGSWMWFLIYCLIQCGWIFL